MNLIETQLTTATAVTAGSVIPTGSTVHRRGCAISNDGSKISIKGAGYFKIIANVTIEPSAIADMTVTLTDNGSEIALATGTPAVANDALNLTLIAIIFNACACATDQIALVAGSAGSVANASVIVERMD